MIKIEIGKIPLPSLLQSEEYNELCFSPYAFLGQSLSADSPAFVLSHGTPSAKFF